MRKHTEKRLQQRLALYGSFLAESEGVVGGAKDMKDVSLLAAILCIALVACADEFSNAPPQTISVRGEVRSPGTYEVTNNMTLRDALLAAGGPTEYGVRLLVMRGTNTVLHVQTSRVMGYHQKTNAVVRNGDVIFVQHME